MVTMLKPGPAAFSLAHLLLGITLVHLAQTAQSYICPRMISLTILCFIPHSFLLGVSLKPHPALIEFDRIHCLDPVTFVSDTEIQVMEYKRKGRSGNRAFS